MSYDWVIDREGEEGRGRGAESWLVMKGAKDAPDRDGGRRWKWKLGVVLVYVLGKRGRRGKYACYIGWCGDMSEIADVRRYGCGQGKNLFGLWRCIRRCYR